MTHISVDPYAWLTPIYAQLRATPGFARLAPSSQFLELCRAATEHSPPKAEAMREWHPAAQSAVLNARFGVGPRMIGDTARTRADVQGL